jgi:chemotaxis protein CheD
MGARQLTIKPCLDGFAGINRYIDVQHQIVAAKILPGEYYVTKHREMITTVLGSCVSVCVYSPELKMGGMNHFMLPGSDNINDSENLLSNSFRYGDVAMERMINDFLRQGADKNQLLFKAFGGSQILRKMTSIGERNIRFLTKFMQMEGLHLSAQDLGGIQPRKIRFFPVTGRVLVKKLQHMHNNTIVRREDNYQHKLDARNDYYGSIDLFES